MGRHAGLGQTLPDGDAGQDQVVEPRVVGQDQRPQMEGPPLQLQPAGGRADAALEPVAAHPTAGPHRALGKIGAAVGQGGQGVGLGDVEAPDVVQAAVVALADHRVDAAGGLADVGAAVQHIPDQRGGHRPHAEGVGEEDGGLEGAQLFDLDKADGLAKAVDDVGRRGHLFVKSVPRVGQQGGDAGLDVAAGQGAVAHRHPRHVADPVQGPGGQAAHRKAPAWLDAHESTSQCGLLVTA